MWYRLLRVMDRMAAAMPEYGVASLVGTQVRPCGQILKIFIYRYIIVFLSMFAIT
jgi:hypothetical protein